MYLTQARVPIHGITALPFSWNRERGILEPDSWRKSWAQLLHSYYLAVETECKTPISSQVQSIQNQKAKEGQAPRCPVPSPSIYRVLSGCRPTFSGLTRATSLSSCSGCMRQLSPAPFLQLRKLRQRQIMYLNFEPSLAPGPSHLVISQNYVRNVNLFLGGGAGRVPSILFCWYKHEEGRLKFPWSGATFVTCKQPLSFLLRWNNIKKKNTESQI